MSTDLLVALDLGTWARSAVSGSMLLAMPVAALAGLVSFFSPCVLPLLPGYLSYATGLTAAEVGSGTGPRRQLLLGTAGFVLGFAVVFVATGTLAGGLGGFLMQYQRQISMVVGVLVIVLGMIYLGVLGWGQQTVRLAITPRFGVAFSPLLGLVFGIGWTPCIGPALSVVLSLGFNEGTAGRGAVLACCYALGLGIPFLLAAGFMSWFSGALGWVKRHQRGVQIAGGVLMVLVGVALVSGLWDVFTAELRQWAARVGMPI